MASEASQNDVKQPLEPGILPNKHPHRIPALTNPKGEGVKTV